MCQAGLWAPALKNTSKTKFCFKKPCFFTSKCLLRVLVLQHYDSGLSEALLLHSRDAESDRLASEGSFFSVFRKLPGATRSEQRTYRMPFLEDVVRGTVGTDDTYIGQCSFYKFSRKSVHFKQSRVAWVDLDLYNIDKELNSATVSEILSHAASLGIPPPTAIVSSGRGCYLKWNFQVAITQYQLPVWQTLQAVLNAAFSTLAADTNARDASRVLRLLETRHSTSGKTVEVIDGCGVLYDFNAFCKQVESLRLDLLIETTSDFSVSAARKVAKKTTVLSRQIQTLGERGDIEALNLYTELHRPIMLNKSSEQSLNWTRFCDLRNLYEQRGGIPVGERDKTLFWMLNFLSHARVIHSSNWDREIRALCGAFPKLETFKPTTDGSMHGLHERLKLKEARKTFRWKGNEVSPLYRPGNRFLIDTFQIQPEEMKNLGTIISPVEKLARSDQKAPGRQERRQQRNGWQSAVAKAFSEEVSGPLEGRHAAGVNISALARHLDVERTRVSRYWQKLVKQANGVPSKSNLDQEVPEIDSLQESGPIAIGPARPALQEFDGIETSIAALQKVPVSDQDAALERECRNILEVARLARLAAMKAVEAKEIQDRLAFERRKLALQESWARRQLSALVAPPAATSAQNQINHGEHPMATTSLAKKKALLEAARAVERGAMPAAGSNPAVDQPKAASASPTPTPDSALNSRPMDEVTSSHVEPASDSKPAAAVQEPSQSTALAPVVPVVIEQMQAQDGPPESEQFDGDGGYGEFFNVSLTNSNGRTISEAPVPAVNKVESKIMAETPISSTHKSGGSTPTLSAAERLRLSLKTHPGNSRVGSSPNTRLPAPQAIKTILSEKPPASSAAAAVRTSVPSAAQPADFKGPATATSVHAKVSETALAVPSSTAAERLRAQLRDGVQRPDSRGGFKSHTSAPVTKTNVPRVVVGAPIYYPSDTEWPSDTLPPGSNYEMESWQEARTGPRGERYEVVEIHTPDRSFLLQLPIIKPDPQDSFESVNDLMGKFYSGCLLVDTSSYCAFPDAPEGEILQNGAVYRVIRPRMDYIFPDRAHRIGKLLNMDLVSPRVIGALPLQDGDVADDNRQSANSEPSPQ